MNASRPTAVGRANSMLAFGENSAIVTALVAQAGPKAAAGIRFKGPVRCDESTLEHLNAIVLPIVERICASLGMPCLGAVICVRTPGAVSANDLPSCVSGYSLDAATLVALLSACTGLPVLQGVAITGHIASTDGDIAAVSALPAKLQAAAADPDIEVVVYPHLEASLSSMAPAAAEQAAGALAQARERLRVSAVCDVAELCQAVFTEQGIIMAALRHGFFGRSATAAIAEDPVGRAAEWILADHEGRFWTVLERLLLAGEIDAARKLLRARARFQIEREAYAEGLGRRLLQLLQSLPPAVLRIKSVPPLLSMRDCIELSQFAAESDYDDVRALQQAAAGKSLSRAAPVVEPEASTPRAPQSGNAALDAVLSEINALTLAKRIGLPIDAARASYQLESSTVDSKVEFLDIVTGFGLHLLRRSGWAPAPLDATAAAAEGLDLLRKAFPAEEQYNAALAEAMHGTKGGLRVVLDAITDRFKKDQSAKHVNRVLVEALDPLDHEEKVAFMTAFLARLAPHLSADIRSEPPERFAGHWKEITRAYVESLDRVNELLRTF